MNYDDELHHDAQLDNENDTTCPYCHGAGVNYHNGIGLSFACPDCHGTGHIEEEEE